MGSQLQNGKQQFVTILGTPLVGGRVYFYQPGTETPMTTYQDSALTIPNTNPVVLDSRGQAVIWGSGTYRQVVVDAFGVQIWDQIVQDETDSSQLTFTQSGTGAVTTTVQAELSALVRMDQFGCIGDGSDETVKVQNALNAAAGKTLIMGDALTYTISSVSIPSDVTIVANGSKFRKLAASNTFAITGGTRLIADRLWLTTPGGPTDTGINLNGGGMQIGEIRIESDAVDSGTTNSSGPSASFINGLIIGPTAAPRVSRDRIDAIYVSQFCRPIVFQNMSNATVGFIQINGFRRGVYVLDCQDCDFGDASVTGLSPSSQGVPGDNGLLIEGSSDASTSNLRIGKWAVSNSGEHAFRLGGSYPIRGFWADDLHAYAPGSGSASTGGSGFKVLGSTSNSYHYNVFVNSLLVEDGAAKGGNFCGIQLGLVDGCQINNAIVRARNNQYSTYDGISILSCNNTQINNPIVKDPARFAARFYTATDAGFPNGTYDTFIQGGYLDTATGTGVAVVEFDGNGGNLNGPIVRSGVRGNTMMRRGSVAANALAVTTGGAYTDCFLDFTYDDSEGAGAILQGTSAFLVNFVINKFTSNNLTPAAPGSTQRSTLAGADNRMYFCGPSGWGPSATSFQVTLADQTAISWTPPSNNGRFFVSMLGLSYYGQAWMRTSPAYTNKIDGGANFAVATTPLTGTTGTSGNVTLATSGGLMYLENRTGSSQNITVYFLG